MNKLNSRHLKLINELIQSFECSNIKFNHFVNRLETLIENLDNSPEFLIKNAQLYWEELEIINAILLDEDDTDGRVDEFRPKINSILNNLSKLTSNYLIREETFKNLINLEIPIRQLKTRLDQLPLEKEKMILITKSDVKSTLTKFIHDKVQLPILNEWAQLIESREEIVYDRSCSEQIRQLIFELGNPDLHNTFTKQKAFEWMSKFER
jgi:hypothetical protein